MRTLLITSATLILPGNRYHRQVIDILIQDGRIAAMGQHLKASDTTTAIISGKGAFLSPGFFDLNVNFGEPGLETKEDIQTGTAAAAAGGFTGVAVHPNTEPAIQSRSEVALLVHASKGNSVDVHPIGAISKKREGLALAELYDMQEAGAIAFSDGDRSIQDPSLMSRALLYAKGFKGLIIARPEDKSIAGGNQMNEGIVSTYLGMKGIPNLAESMMVARDLYLAAYHEAPIHFSTISTAEAVDLIRKAKAKGQPVTCDVAAHHLVLTDEAVAGFDSHYKVSPPLRTQKDIQALLKGVKDGVIDAIVSQHSPHEVEFKQVEFQIAENGIIGLQTVLPLLIQAGLDEETIVEKIALAPRRILGLPIPIFEEGEIANLVLFDTKKKWVFDELSNKSKSANSPFLGQEMTGEALLILNS